MYSWLTKTFKRTGPQTSPQARTQPPRPPPPPPTSTTTTTTATSSSSVRQRFSAQPTTVSQSLRQQIQDRVQQTTAVIAAADAAIASATIAAATRPTAPAPVEPDLEANASNPNPNPNPNPNLFNRLRVLISNAIGKFYNSLFPRAEEFRTVHATTFTDFDADSTRKNDIFWYSYKLVFVLGIYGAFLSVLASLFYLIYGEATKSPPTHLHSFKLISPAANTVSLCLVPFLFTVVFVASANKFWADIHFYRIREKYMAFVSLDLVVNLRIIKAVLLTIYGLHNFEKKWGDWTIIMFVLLPFSLTMSGISFLKLFEREFLNATGLLRDFAVILVGPCFTYLYQAYQHYHSHPDDSHDYSLMKGLFFLIPILFGYISNQFIGYIYRPHTRKMKYAPDQAENVNFGPIPYVRR